MIDNGERMIPASHKGQMVYGEHIVRYRAVAPLAIGKKVLDIASGSGYGSQILALKAATVIGIDINVESVAYAKKNFSAPNLNYKVGSATEIPIKNADVDMVVSFETIEHLEDYHKYLSEIKRVLTPNGLFVVSTPNDREFSEQNIFHLHEFVLEELEPLLHQYFKNIEIYFQGTWLYNALLNREDFEGEWDKPLQTIKTLTQPADKAVYFTVVCSNGPVPYLDTYSAISAPWSAREIEQNRQFNKELKDEYDEIERKLAIRNNEVTVNNKKLQEVNYELKKVYDSRSWKFVSKIRHLWHYIH